MMWLIIILLAAIQGITEFLPISSSGHLVVVQELFKQFNQPLPESEILVLDVVLHLGTLLAVVVFYWRRVWGLVVRDQRVIALLLVGSIPAGIVGIALKEQLENVFANLPAVGCLFFVTGAMLLWADRHPVGQATYRELGFGRALLIGLFQAFAILPGISRSGSTITAGLGAGLRRDEAAAFSFLLAIPAIAGAGLIEGLHRFKTPPDPTFAVMLAVGALVSFLVGLLALWWLVRWLEKGRLHWFAWWVFAMGAGVLLWQLF